MSRRPTPDSRRSTKEKARRYSQRAFALDEILSWCLRAQSCRAVRGTVMVHPMRVMDERHATRQVRSSPVRNANRRMQALKHGNTETRKPIGLGRSVLPWFRERHSLRRRRGARRHGLARKLLRPVGRVPGEDGGDGALLRRVFLLHAIERIHVRVMRA